MKSLLMASLCFFSFLVAFSSNSLLHIIDLMNEDGSLKLSTDNYRSFNITGVDIILDECKGVVVKPMKTNSTWSALGTGLPAICRAIAVDGSGNIYAGGEFTTAGGVSANRIAKWNGTSWSALGTGFSSGACYAIAVDGNGNVYAGGTFIQAGGISASRIAMWNGSVWSSLGTGLNGTCSTIGIDNNDDVYVGGSFTTAGGIIVNRIAKWDSDASSWSALSTGLNGTCQSIAIHNNGNVTAGGGFSAAGGVLISRIAQWNGSAWSGLGTGLSGGNCNAVIVDANGNIYAGGTFTSAGGNTANKIAQWNGSTWSTLGSGLNNTCWDLALDGDGNLFAGGAFTDAGGTSANRIAKWDGMNWTNLGSGLNQQVESNALVVAPDGLYAGGNFSMAGGNAVNKIAKWDGATLPVEFLFFNATVELNSINLVWKTVRENFNLGFEIQRGQNENNGFINWEKIAFVQGKGNSFQHQHYDYKDKNPQLGNNYYRLKQIDFDGAFNYSDIISIEFNKGKIQIFPNPIQNRMVSIKINNMEIEDLSFDIFDETGRLVYTSAINSSFLELNIPKLEMGTYLFKIKKGKILIKKERIIVIK